MTRDEQGNLIRPEGNPHGLGPMPTKAENAARKRRLRKAAATSTVAIERLEAIKARCLATGAVELPPLVWHEEKP